MGTLKLQSNRPIYINTVIGTVAVNNERQQRTHGHRWLNGELKARQDQQMIVCVITSRAVIAELNFAFNAPV